MLKTWRKEMSSKKIPFTDDLDVVKMLVDNATIADWNVEGLPNDELSIQNGLIVTKASRYASLLFFFCVENLYKVEFFFSLLHIL